MNKAKTFLLDMLKGGAIGIAMIIPGVSGGTLAVMMGVYDKIIESIGGLFKHFKKSVLCLLPILLGAILAFAAMYVPLQYALEYAPFPTILLFAGFMLGSCPDLIMQSKDNGFKKFDVASVIIPLAVVVGICFIPSMGSVDLTPSMQTGGYFLLLLMGFLASCALVVPGISGSMLMLIFGYYQPLMDTIKGIFTNFGHSALVLCCFAIGVVIGFFTIAKLMQILLKKFPRSTMWAIVGFVIGSIPAVVITFFHEYGAACLNPLQISLGVVMFIVGGVATFLLAAYARKVTQKMQSAPQELATEQQAATTEESGTNE